MEKTQAFVLAMAPEDEMKKFKKFERCPHMQSLLFTAKGVRISEGKGYIKFACRFGSFIHLDGDNSEEDWQNKFDVSRTNPETGVEEFTFYCTDDWKMSLRQVIFKQVVYAEV